jgi:hypothetical protein
MDLWRSQLSQPSLHNKRLAPGNRYQSQVSGIPLFTRWISYRPRVSYRFMARLERHAFRFAIVCSPENGLPSFCFRGRIETTRRTPTT